jgi:hypothetical protein
MGYSSYDRVSKGDSIQSRCREVLGNTICLEAARSELQRVLYLNQLCRSHSQQAIIPFQLTSN